MTRRKAADAATVTEGPVECLLCGGGMADVWNGTEYVAFEVCAVCNAGFVGIVRDLDRAAQARQARLEVVAQVVHVAGQLDLDDAAQAATPALTGGQWDQVFRGLATDDWTGVDTMLVAEAVREGTWTQGLTHAELQKLRRVLARRA